MMRRSAAKLQLKPEANSERLAFRLYDQKGLIHPNSLGVKSIFKRLIEKFYYERNLTVRAPYVQWKRDWSLVSDLLENNERLRNGLQVVEKEKTRYETTWRYTKLRVKDTNKLLVSRIEEALRAVQKGNLEQKLGFTTEIKESTLLEHNRSFHHKKGLFAKGKIKQGEIVGMIPGMIWQGYHKLSKTNPTDSKGNATRCSPYFYNRSSLIDGAIFEADLDAFPDLYRKFTDEEVRKGFLLYHSQVAEYVKIYGTSSREGMGKLEAYVRTLYGPVLLYIFHRLINRNITPYLPNEEWAPRAGLKGILGLKWDHEFSHANYINHCGEEKLPNTILVPVSLPVQFPKDLLPYVPNRVQPKIFKDDPVNMLLYDEYYKCNSRAIVQNQLRFGKKFAGHGTAQETQFLYLVNTMVAVTLRDIDDGEELFTNLRLPRQRSYEFPLSYVPAPGFEVEDLLHHNKWHDETTYFRRLLGIYDPHITIADALKDTRHFDRDLAYYIGRLFGIK
eukprot:TRINITY_DN18844_c0_g1_i1.p1 TRINITY_DN18844_c0_g1~~TRINITY_DN18844_c0_g1_i1.p1  ORF type:complete len:503 (+),score=41.85 TRINITY_DN18844_c0_g1_i1:85-1593(+)